jgi:uncharacterized membrane protein YfcA
VEPFVTDLSFIFFPFIFLVLVFGGFAKGAIGFGLIVTTVPFLSMVMPPKDAMAWMAIPILLLNVYALALTWKEWRELPRVVVFLVMGIFFVPVGVHVVFWMPADITRACIGFFILVVVAMRLAGWQPERKNIKGDQLISAIWGCAAGFIHGSLMMPAPPIVLYLNFRSFPKDTFVFLLNTIATSFLLLQVLTFASLKSYSVGAGWQILLTLVPAVLGMWIGNRFRQRISQTTFERMVLGLLGLVGISLMARNLIRLW